MKTLGTFIAAAMLVAAGVAQAASPLDKIDRLDQPDPPAKAQPTKAIATASKDMPLKGMVTVILSRVEPRGSACEAQLQVYSNNDGADLDLRVLAVDANGRNLKSKRLKLAFGQMVDGEPQSLMFTGTSCSAISGFELRPNSGSTPPACVRSGTTSRMCTITTESRPQVRASFDYLDRSALVLDDD